MFRAVQFNAHPAPPFRTAYAAVTEQLRAFVSAATVAVSRARSRQVADEIVRHVNVVLARYNDLAWLVSQQPDVFIHEECARIGYASLECQESLAAQKTPGADPIPNTWHDEASVLRDIQSTSTAVTRALRAIQQLGQRTASVLTLTNAMTALRSAAATAEAPMTTPAHTTAPTARQDRDIRTVPATQVPAQRSSGMLWAWAFMLGGGALIFLGMTKKARR